MTDDVASTGRRGIGEVMAGAAKAWLGLLDGEQRAAMRLVASGLSTPGYVTVLPGGAVNRPLARVEDLARELMRSLDPVLAGRALLSPKAPSDVVTANRSVVTAGDRVIPLAGIWRDERFPDVAEQAKLQALSDAIDEAAGYEEADHLALEWTADPRGISGADLGAAQRNLLRGLLGTYFGRVPEAASPLPATTTTRSLPSTSPGPAPPSPAGRTITGSRDHAY